MFQFPLQWDSVGVPRCRGKSVPIKEPFPKKRCSVSTFLTRGGRRTSEGTVEGRCAVVAHVPRGAAGPSSPSPPQSRPRQAQGCARRRCFGKNSLCRTTDREFGLRDTGHKFRQPPRVFRFSFNVRNGSEFRRLCFTLLDKANVNLWILTSPFWIRTVSNQA